MSKRDHTMTLVYIRSRSDPCLCRRDIPSPLVFSYDVSVRSRENHPFFPGMPARKAFTRSLRSTIAMNLVQSAALACLWM